MSTQQPGAAEAVSTAETDPAEPTNAEQPPALAEPANAEQPSTVAEPANAEQPPALAEPALAELGYTAAMAELEQILAALEDEDPDVDMLAARVERASDLIEICRGRIRNASIQVERVVAALEQDAAS